MVCPILEYGCELWGNNRVLIMENIQVQFCKYILGVPKSTSNVAVLGECGRLPLYVRFLVRYIKYWVKLLHMPTERYPKRIYCMLENLENAGRMTWASNVKKYCANMNLVMLGFVRMWAQSLLTNLKIV
jgi:hypothetical protein